MIAKTRVSLKVVLTLSLIFLSSLSGAQQQHAPTPVDSGPASQKVSGQDTQSTEPSHSSVPSEVVVVTGTFSPVPLEEVDRAVSVLQLQQQPLLYGHWTDYLETDPSVDLRQRTPNGVQADLSIRGSSFGETLILVDGLRMDDAQTGHHDMDLPLPTASISRIEILRGAGSTLYGSEAMGGAVNFVTASATRSEVRVSAGIGSFGTNQQGASVSVLEKRWDESLNVARDSSSGFAADRDYRSLTALSATNARTKLGLTSLLLGYGDKPYGANQFYGPFDSWERTKSWFAGLKQELGTKTEFDLGFRRHSDEFILFRNRPAIYENNHISESWQGALRRNQTVWKKAEIHYGAEGEDDSIKSNNLGNHARSRGAGYFDVDLRSLGRFSLSVGARGEFFDSGDTELSPSVSGGIWLRQGWKLKAGASHAFRLPTYTDLYYRDPANVGNPALKPESAWNYEGGVERAGNRLKFDLTGFQLRQQNVIDYVQFFPGDLFHAENLQRITFTGVETSVEVRISDAQRLTVAYTGLHGAQHALNGMSSRYVFNYPIDHGVVGWQGSLPCRILSRVNVKAVHRFDRDPYALLDVAFAREFGNLVTRLSLSNITDTKYQEIQGVAMPGRAVLFGVEYVIVKKTQ